MSWQDVVLSIVVIGFSYALIPQVIKGFKVKRGLITLQTGLITAIGLYICVIVNISLKLYVTGALNFCTATCWLLLAIQRIKWGDIENG